VRDDSEWTPNRGRVGTMAPDDCECVAVRIERIGCSQRKIGVPRFDVLGTVRAGNLAGYLRPF
jgi:hypothetical protein